MIIAMIVSNIQEVPFTLLSVLIYAFVEITSFNGMAIRLYKKHVQFIENTVFCLFKNM